MLTTYNDPNMTTRIDGVGVREGRGVVDHSNWVGDYTSLPDGRIISMEPIAPAVLRPRTLHCAWDSCQLYPDPEGGR